MNESDEKKCKYLDKPEQWEKLCDYIIKNKLTTGLDSEFTGVDFKAGQSCPSRAQIHVWSVGIPTGDLNPRGYREAVGVVLPGAAIEVFRDYLENPRLIKFAHNSPVDVHAFYNAGVDALGVINTLSLARWVYPNRLTQSLDSLARDYLGKSKFISFKELVTEPNYVEKEIQVKYCSCGVEGCRKRKGHDKLLRTEYVIVEKGTRQIPLDSIVPGHKRFDVLREYAGQDAVLAFEIADYLIGQARKKEIEVPWL